MNERKERKYFRPGVDMVDCIIVSNYLLLSLFGLIFFHDIDIKLDLATFLWPVKVSRNDTCHF